MCPLREPEFLKNTMFLQDQAYHRKHKSALAHFCTSNDRVHTDGPMSEKLNVDVRNEQNLMLFTKHVQYINFMCARALPRNSKRKKTPTRDDDEGNNEL